jgi:hypothetical protein
MISIDLIIVISRSRDCPLLVQFPCAPSASIWPFYAHSVLYQEGAPLGRAFPGSAMRQRGKARPSACLVPSCSALGIRKVLLVAPSSFIQFLRGRSHHGSLLPCSSTSAYTPQTEGTTSTFCMYPVRKRKERYLGRSFPKFFNQGRSFLIQGRQT